MASPARRSRGITPQPIPSGYGWNERAHRYTRGGRFVSGREVRGAVDQFIGGMKKEIISISERLRSGVIGVGEWQREMAGAMKSLHIANAVAGRGGWAQMEQGDWGRVGNVLKEQYKYLEKFAIQVEKGAQALDGRFLTRAGMYGDAGRETYENIRREGEKEIGLTRERNVLGAADHCDECLDLTEMGWVEIGSLPLPGERLCRTNCKCTIERGRGGE
jgi:hypothetical protein